MAWCIGAGAEAEGEAVVLSESCKDAGIKASTALLICTCSLPLRAVLTAAGASAVPQEDAEVEAGAADDKVVSLIAAAVLTGAGILLTTGEGGAGAA